MTQTFETEWLDIKWFRIWTSALENEMGMSIKAGMIVKDGCMLRKHLTTIYLASLKKEKEKHTKICPMSAWAMISLVSERQIEWQMLLSQLPCEHSDKMAS